MIPVDVQALGSMSFAAAVYGGNGPAFCGLRTDGSHVVECFGSDAASVYGAPRRLSLTGLTAGDGFVCGLTSSSQLPYCWGNNIYVQQGIPVSRGANVSYTQICAGDNHLCALRQASSSQDTVVVDCWGYNMTGSFVEAPLLSITAGSLFTCGLYASNRTPICWGDETGSRVISEAPKLARFSSIAAGGYHVCGILEASGATLCWGRVLAAQNGFPGNAIFSSLVGGKFHACGLLATHHTPSCWGLIDPPNSTPAPSSSKFSALVAGDYYTCGISVNSLQPLCWGSESPAVLPTAVSPGLCSSQPCDSGKYALVVGDIFASRTGCLDGQWVCIPCSQNCPPDMFESSPCSPNGDRQCTVNCSLCAATTCPSECLSHFRANSIQNPIIIGELAIAVIVVGVILSTGIFLVRYKLARAAIAKKENLSAAAKHVSANTGSFRSSFRKEKVKPELEEPNMSRAEVFSYQELEQATCGFGKEYEVGKGSFSCVFKGVLGDGRVVAVKRAAARSQHKDSNEFHNELDLLSRLNHAHLLTLLGFCEDREERLLVYEFMGNGTLHEQLHGNSNGRLGWVRRVTIAVQAARGLEYLHGYACPPVIHRDIKSSNILLDDEWNARVSDFGLSLLGPPDSNSPLSELPAGTLGYLDPEYYRLHYLTTKSDVYSFGVLLLEILSGRKAIDMQYDEGNIVEWAVPLIKEGEVLSVLDPRLEPPRNLEAMQKIAKVAARCVKMRGKDRPSMDKVTTSLERALAILMGTFSDAQPFLPSEVVLGSNRLHRKSSQKSSCRSNFDVESSEATEEHRENRHPSSVTLPSLNSSQRRRSLSENYEADLKLGSVDIIVPPADHSAEFKLQQQQITGNNLWQHRPEIYPASPQERLFLHSNF